VHAAGVVTDHAADGAAVVRGGIGAESEVVLFGGGAQMIEYDSRLNASDAANGINFEDRRHIFGKIQNHGDVATLAGERSAAATAEERSPELAAECNRCKNVIVIPGQHYSDGNLTVVRAVGGVESARAAIEADISCNTSLKSLSQLYRIHVRGLGRWGGFREAIWHVTGFLRYTDRTVPNPVMLNPNYLWVTLVI
jgi:hypothetical protein